MTKATPCGKLARLAAALAALLLAAGCGSPLFRGLLKEPQLAELEALYGQPVTAVLQGFGLTTKEVVAWESPEAYEVFQTDANARTVVDGVWFYRRLLFDLETQRFYGLELRSEWLYFTWTEALLEPLLERAQSLYGEPTTSPETPHRILSGAFLQELKQALDSAAVSQEWTETWDLEGTRFSLTVKVPDNSGQAMVIAAYHDAGRDPE